MCVCVRESEAVSVVLVLKLRWKRRGIIIAGFSAQIPFLSVRAEGFVVGEEVASKKD